MRTYPERLPKPTSKGHVIRSATRSLFLVGRNTLLLVTLVLAIPMSSIAQPPLHEQAFAQPEAAKNKKGASSGSSKSQTCAPDCGGLLSNGGFELTTTSCLPGFSDEVLCWEVYSASPDMDGPGCFSAVETYNNAADNDVFIGLRGNTDWEEGLQATLCAPLVTGNSYTISFWAKVLGDPFNGIAAPISFGAAASIQPTPVNNDIEFASDPNIEVLGTAMVQYLANEPWQEASISFVYSGTNASTLLFGFDGSQNSSAGNRYAFVDDIRLTEMDPSEPVLDPVGPLCDNEVVSLSTSPSATGGVFSGSAVLPGGATGFLFDASLAEQGGNMVSFQYTDANGCSVTLWQNVEVLNDCECVGLELLITGTIVDDDCVSPGSGSISAVVSGSAAVGPFTFDWFDPTGNNIATNIITMGFTDLVDGLSEGHHTLIVTNGAGCSWEVTFYVAPTDLELVATVTHVTCFGGSDGSICLSIPGGGPNTIFFFESWGNPLPGNCVDGLPAGCYTVLAADPPCTDAYGLQVCIEEPPPLVITENITPPDDCDGTTWDLVITISGGMPGYTSTLSGGPFQQPLPFQWYYNLQCGIDYTFTTTDNNGCQATEVYNVPCPPDSPVVTDVVVEASCPDAGPPPSDGSIDIIMTGGSGNFEYEWWPNGETTEDLNNVPAGIYQLTWTDEDTDCMGTYVVIVPSCCMEVVETIGEISECDPCDAFIDLDLSGFTGVQNIEWFSTDGYSNNVEDIDGLCAGIYWVVIDYDFGCQETFGAWLVTDGDDCPTDPISCSLIVDNNIQTGNQPNFGKALLTYPDGSYTVVGRMHESVSDIDHYFASYDAADAVTFHGTIGDFNLTSRREATHAITENAGVIYSAGYSTSLVSRDVVVHRSEVDNTGTLQVQSWRYDFNNESDEEANAIVYVPAGPSGNEELYVIGSMANNATGNDDMFVLRIRATDGVLLDMKFFGGWFTDDHCNDAILLPNGLGIILAGDVRGHAAALWVDMSLGMVDGFSYNADSSPGTSINSLVQHGNTLFMVGEYDPGSNVAMDMLYMRAEFDQTLLTLEPVEQRFMANGVQNRAEVANDVVLRDDGSLFIAGEVDIPSFFTPTFDHAGLLMQVTPGATSGLTIDWSNITDLTQDDEALNALELAGASRLLATGWLDEGNGAEIFNVRADQTGASCCMSPYPIATGGYTGTPTNLFDHKPGTVNSWQYGTWTPYHNVDPICPGGFKSHDGAITSTEMELKAVPNPSFGQFDLRLTGGEGSIEGILVTDLFGARVLQLGAPKRSASSMELDLGEVAAGTYLVEVRTSIGERKIVRVVVAH